MIQKLVYLVQRYEMPLDAPGIHKFPEYVFESVEKAKEYCLKQDPEDKGFEYTCPCGCGDIHWRSWEFETIVMESGQ